MEVMVKDDTPHPCTPPASPHLSPAAISQSPHKPHQCPAEHPQGDQCAWYGSVGGNLWAGSQALILSISPATHKELFFVLLETKALLTILQDDLLVKLVAGINIKGDEVSGFNGVNLNAAFDQRNPSTHSSLGWIQFLSELSGAVDDDWLTHASHSDLVNDPLKKAVVKFKVVCRTFTAIVHVQEVGITEWVFNVVHSES